MKLQKLFRKSVSALLAMVLGTGMLVSPSACPEPTAAAVGNTIYNDTFWKDTSGNNIYSQGGGVFQFGDTYYWYGVHYNGADTYAANPTKKVNDTSFRSVTCYSSKDLVNWKFENDVLTANTKNFGWAYWVGRMGVAYCAKTKKYVLVTQYNDSILFASCDTPTGNFQVETVQDQIQNVLKQGTGDQTLFVDDDGQAYLVCSNKGGRGHQYISKLRASDFLYAEPAVEVAKGKGREGNCLFKYKGKYYFCASDLHGWNASHSYYMVADKITGPYSDWKVMEGTDEDFSYVTYVVYQKDVKQDATVTLGAINLNQAVNYVVLAAENTAEPVIPGDVNEDGMVNGMDLARMCRALLGQSLNRNALRRADLNGTGSVEIADAVVLTKFLLGGSKN